MRFCCNKPLKHGISFGSGPQAEVAEIVSRSLVGLKESAGVFKGKRAKLYPEERRPLLGGDGKFSTMVTYGDVEKRKCPK